MVDINSILKAAADKLKDVTARKDIPLADAFSQMDADLEAAEQAVGGNFFPDDGKPISPEEVYLGQLGFKDENPSFDDIKARYEKLIVKFNPANFEGDEKKQIKAAKKIAEINDAYNYFQAKEAEKNERERE